MAEPPPHPLRSVWQLLRQDGLLGPFALCAAMALAAGAIVIETLLLRGLFDITAQLGLPHQRLLALLALLAFAALLLALEVPIVAESLRHGRHLEARLRMALLAKLPRLADRYLQSRSISDMAERSHSIQHSRQVPALGLSFVQSVAELLLTVLGVALISPGSTALAGASALCAMLLPALFQPWLAERDLRLRHHASALHGFYLDALTGLIPVRAHRAGRAVRRQHEGLLVEWVRASRGLIATTSAASGTQGLVCTLLSAGLLVNHFLHAGGVGGADLLLVYWTLKLPALGNGVGALLRQYPQQRNILLRLLEPLAAPEEPTAATTSEATPDAAAAVAISIRNGSVLAAGQRILRDVNLHIAPGEHVAVIGASGAGKSSLIGLLLGWHRLASGQLQIDGQALDAGSQQTLRRHTAWVDPGVQIWNRSFLDNLCYVSADESLAQVGEITAAAQLHGVLQKLPQGLRSVLGEGGALRSGGEGQRLRLARAFMQSGARLVLLDEPSAASTAASARRCWLKQGTWWQAQTLLCVTHDVGQTLAFARVLVVEQGRIVEDGAPAALAAEDSRYAALLAVGLACMVASQSPQSAGGSRKYKPLAKSRKGRRRVAPTPLWDRCGGEAVYRQSVLGGSSLPTAAVASTRCRLVPHSVALKSMRRRITSRGATVMSIARTKAAVPAASGAAIEVPLQVP